MLLGTFFPKLDEKGRLALPAKFRNAMLEGVVVTRGQERCLTIYSSQEFAKLVGPVIEASPTVKTTREYQRWLTHGASEEEPDRQGRVTLPQHLREYAHLDRDTVVVGVSNRLEVWEPTAYASYSSFLDDEYADFNDVVAPG